MAEDTKTTFKELIEIYPLELKLPPAIVQDLQRKGVSTTLRDDSRVAPRFRTNGPAIMEWLGSPAALSLNHPTSQIIVRDLSKTGVCILSDRQWFPEQTCKLIFAIGELTGRIMRSRRLGPRCWEVGLLVTSFHRLPI